MALPPNIRIQVPVPFPNNVQGTGPIAIVKNNGKWQVTFNIANLAIQGPPPSLSLANDYVLAWDNTAKQFFQVPLNIIATPLLLNTIQISNAVSVQDITSITAAFADYMIVFENVVPVTTTVHFEMLVQSGGTFQSTGYLNNAGGITTYIDITNGANITNTAGLGVSGRLRIYNVNSTANNKLMTWEVAFNNAGAAGVTQGSGWWNGGQGTVTGFQFLMSSGNISTGTIKIYGLQ